MPSLEGNQIQKILEFWKPRDQTFYKHLNLCKINLGAMEFEEQSKTKKSKPIVEN